MAKIEINCQSDSIYYNLNIAKCVDKALCLQYMQSNRTKKTGQVIVLMIMYPLQLSYQRTMPKCCMIYHNACRHYV